MTIDFAVTDAQLLSIAWAKWSFYPPDVLPAWMAEMDVRPCPAVQESVRSAVDQGMFGYPPLDRETGLGAATAGFLSGRFGWTVDPARVLMCADIMSGLRLVLETLCVDAPVVVPAPAYKPFRDVVTLSGRTVIEVACREGERSVLDLDAIEAAFAAGARTIILCQPYNPLGVVLTKAELTAVRDIVVRHGGRVISDEIHAPLVLPGARHLPYASLSDTAEHVTTLFSASKAWNIPGLKCAQIIVGNDEDLARLRSLPHVANASTAILGVVATIAAYTEGEPWLNSAIDYLAAQRDYFAELLSSHLPRARWRPMEAGYLAWVDARAYGLADPSATALELTRVAVSPGSRFGDSYTGYVRINLATSRERLTEVVGRLVKAWE
ncbi:MalY/PatB family protein [Paractinoplanes maris]|uniref:MalY/PatB family protein n=1 Tax=Paractinoplanes maris TaxID=1734446 RepID=UPI002020B5A5|nr:aminotransferase class I/II-fold pyridoxal phosphate-dependent enzyme [Actinoplanes maris]